MLIYLLRSIMKNEITEFGPYSGKHVNLFILKNIIKNCIKIICRPFLYCYFVLRFKNIWNLKRYLVQKDKTGGLLSSYYIEYFNKKASYVGLKAEMNDIPCFPHGLYGIFISEHAKIGKNCVIFQKVTIGANTILNSKGYGYPTIGNNVYIGAGAKIIGNVRIGDNCRIGANTVVTKDMKPNTLAVSQETRYIEKAEKLDNRYIIKSKTGLFYYDEGLYKKMGDNNEKRK